MKELDIIMGYSCNNNCRFCCEKGNSGDKSTKEIISKINKAKEDGIDRLVFSGGEPTIRKDIIDLVSYAKKLDFEEIFMITNGRAMSYDKFSNDIIDAGLTHILFSLHAPNPQVHDFLTQVNGSYYQIIKGMKNAINKGIVIENNTVLTKYNYHLFSELADKLVEMGVDYYEAIFVNPVNNLEDKNISPKLSDLDKYIYEAMKKGDENKIWSTIEGVPFCHLRGIEEHATELYMAENRTLTGPSERLVEDINNSRQIMAKVKPDKCKECKYYNICEGIWGNYFKKSGDKELIPIPGEKIKSKKEMRTGWKELKL